MSGNVTNINAKAAVKLRQKLTSALTTSFPWLVVVKTILAIYKPSALPAIIRKRTGLIPGLDAISICSNSCMDAIGGRGHS
ncbi:hypothetical protein A6S26_11185 [Nostoc sp. ATCC 43529]|nr:hypothetical protein A6S26_11185 [Nostoc sp. ATCC 43529]